MFDEIIVVDSRT